MMEMRRILIQIDEETYRALKLRARHEKRSVASIVRETIAVPARRAITVEDFGFVGSGEASDDRRKNVSENHDRELAAAFSSRRGARHK